jgi:N4-gp56 family major capsid protein
MPTSYTNTISSQTLADAVAMDSNVKAQLWARYLEVGSRAHDAFAMFESDQPRIPVANAGKNGIFCRRRDLKAQGGDKVNFTVISAPGGPGVMGETQLAGAESKSKFKTYSVEVDWHRDAVAFTKKQIAFMAAGNALQETTAELLKLKMGLWKQNDMMMCLIKRGSGNTYRPNGRTSRNAIGPNDTLSMSMSVAGKARLNTLGAKPISHKLGENGDHINGFMTFASEFAFLNIRNDSGYQNALQSADDRGKNNSLFTGKLVQWQGQNFFEHIVTDQDWDDYVGSPIQPKAIMTANLAVDTGNTFRFTAASAVGDCVLKMSSTNTTNRYFQFWPGYDYKFTDTQSAVSDSTAYYAWAVNPDGTVCWLGYTGSGNDGNKIVVTKILSAAAGTSTLGATTVGNIYLGVGGSLAVDGTTRVLTKGGGTPLGINGDFTYVDGVKSGAVLIPANSYGVPIGYGFIFGAHAACRAYGAIEMNGIEQETDYSFVKGKGYEMVFGQSPTINTNGVTNGYLLMEFAIEHEGYPVPSYDQYAV